MTRRRITIFDTTLRDGEQSPGIALQPDEKAEIAEQLERLGVDVIEAGFPASSPGDFEGVRAVARTVERTTVAALARTRKEDVDAAVEAVAGAPLAAPRLHRHERAAHGAQARPRARGGRRAGPLVGRLRRRPRRRGRVLGRGRDALRSRLPRPRLPGGDRGRRDDDQPPRHRRLLPAGRACRVPARRPAALPGARRRHALRPLPRRPRPRGGELAGRRRARAPARSSAPSTASASAPATRRSRRS